MQIRGIHLSVLLAFGCASASQTQSDVPAPAAAIEPVARENGARRPLPQPVVPPPGYQQAIEQGTRTATGEPGPRYWVNTASYTIDARLDVDAKRLEASARIVYYNRSPDVLENLHVDLTQNFHAPGVVRFEEAEVTGGVQLTRVEVDGHQLTTEGEGPRYLVSNTRLAILPPRPVQSGDSAVLRIDWSFAIPQAGAGARMGYARDDLFFLAYWYPQMAVYDDVIGWHPDPFTGVTEFYADHARYEVTVDAPAGWLVMATGTLQNPEQTLSAGVIERVRRAEMSDSVITVIGADDFTRATQPGEDGRLRWRFAADSVRDFAFSATRASIWDARRTPVGDRDGDGRADYARVDAIYRTSAPFWRNAARYSAHSIDFLSRYTAQPYPWPHMTAVEAGEIIGGGMEFPMMTLIGDYNERGDSALYYVIAHELAHMWVPMMVSTDERRYSWMDEGMTTFAENQARMEYYPGVNHNLPDASSYLQLAQAGEEGEMMRRSPFHYHGAAYGVASYSKPATVLVALRGVLGDDVFLRAYREFLRRWRYKHPYPWDLWATFEDVSGRNLEWFWRSWYYETWVLDQAIAGVATGADGTRIVIEDRGLVPMPVYLLITLQNGETLRREIPVERWLTGVRDTVLLIETSSPIVRVEIDAENVFPDIDRGNNVWRR